MHSDAEAFVAAVISALPATPQRLNYFRKAQTTDT